MYIYMHIYIYIYIYTYIHECDEIMKKEKTTPSRKSNIYLNV